MDIKGSQLSVYLCTWNVAGINPPENISSLLKIPSKYNFDLYAIGVQELSSHVKDLVRDSIYNDPWTVALTKIFHERNYIRLSCIRLMGLHLIVFMRQALIRFVHGIENAYTGTGFNGMWGNKGAVSCRLDIAGVSICIVNCHLAAHLPNVATRIRDYDMIIENQLFLHPDTKNILDHDYVFWMGDLNFRIEQLSHHEVLDCIMKKSFKHLQNYDQLKLLMKDELILVKFEEGEIKFSPTYKFDIGTDLYDTSSKQRKPGWCDRILWLVHEHSIDDLPLKVKLHHYTSHAHCRVSDHRPVSASFSIKAYDRQTLRMLALECYEPPIVFDPIPGWFCEADGAFSYSVYTEMRLSKWDWIGLYKVSSTHYKEYITWVYAPVRDVGVLLGRGQHYAEFIKQLYIRDLEGDFVMGFYNDFRKCIMGYSAVFKIRSKRRKHLSPCRPKVKAT